MFIKPFPKYNKTSFSGRKPIVVMDAGIATDDNVDMLRDKGYDYLCVARSNLKAYHADIDSKPITIRDKKEQPIELLKVKSSKNNDNYLWVKSHTKALKENSMNGLLSQRFQEGIHNKAPVKAKRLPLRLERNHRRDVHTEVCYNKPNKH